MPELRHYNPIWVIKQPIAHRGLHGPDAPENSLEAFRAAAEAGYAIELDIHLVNGRLVVAHDTSAARAFTEAVAPLPSLSEVFETVAGRVPIVIEVKWPAKIRLLGPPLLNALASYSGEIAVASFDPRVLIWLRRHAPHIPRIQLASLLPNKPWPHLVRAALCAMPLNFFAWPQFIAYDLRDYPSRSLSFWHRRLRAPIVLWTIRNSEQLTAARAAGCNIIFENTRP